MEVAPAGLLERAAALFAAGGVVLVVLVALSVAGLAIVIVKLVQFRRCRLGDRDFLAPAFEAMRERDVGRLHRALNGQPHPVAELLRRIATYPKPDRAALDADLEFRARAILADLRRYLRFLEVIVQLSPLLGLLGTVLGMIEAFEALQAAGGRADPGLLAGGISKALVTTAAGLVIAIPASAVLTLFEARLDRLRQEMEGTVNHALDILEEGGGAA
ncbi:MAG: MotA/TolQ/ExbB proton channel family protein [Geminicoccaceae bacterium]|nr:MotA/TolQ/ExbB proton channel family protein [Geminicoccaceae bacterium]